MRRSDHSVRRQEAGGKSPDSIKDPQFRFTQVFNFINDAMPTWKKLRPNTPLLVLAYIHFAESPLVFVPRPEAVYSSFLEYSCLLGEVRLVRVGDASDRSPSEKVIRHFATGCASGRRTTNYSAMTQSEKQYVDHLIHQVFVDVDEKGTTAAATYG